ncbi:MAG: DUF3108 domain-containing protein [Flavobacteriaceae bacterium]|nr:DUF3108 domain-containing protein [Flavobacteriaceae bacterium]
MRKICFLLLLVSFYSFSQKNILSFEAGEFLKYRISYGILNAGFATLEVENSIIKKDTSFHITGKGWTTGMVNFVFSVEDNYQTYINKQTKKPSHFIRKINEGGYKKDKEIYFDYQALQATVIDHKHNTKKYYSIENDVQDMLSTLYYLRGLNFDELNNGDIISLNMFLDQETYKTNIKLIKREVIKTKFGKVNTLVFKPSVVEGRVFDDKETVSFWITDDKNKIPVKIKASILVGSIKAELIEYKGLANSFPIIFN